MLDSLSMIDTVTVSRSLYPVALVLAAGLIVALPAIRLWRRTGTWAITGGRTRDPIERLVQFVGLSCALALGVWGFAYAALGPEALGVWPMPAWVTWLGWALVAAGLVLVMAAQWQMGTSWRIGIDAAATSLVTSGLFRWVRNPIYSGLLVVDLGLFVVSPSLWLAAILLVSVSLIHFETRREEKHLVRLHGQPYEEWAGRVGRFVPWIGRLR